MCSSTLISTFGMTRGRTLDIRVLKCRLDPLSIQATTRRTRAGSSHHDSRQSSSLTPVPLRIFATLPRSPRRCGAAWTSLNCHGATDPSPPFPSATGHGHCPLVYPRGIRRTTREDESRALWVNTHARVDVVVRVVHTLFTRDTCSPVTGQRYYRVLSCHDCYHQVINVSAQIKSISLIKVVFVILSMLTLDIL